MFIDKNEQVVFSVFDTDNLENIRLLLDKETNDIDKYKLLYHQLDIENDDFGKVTLPRYFMKDEDGKKLCVELEYRRTK